GSVHEAPPSSLIRMRPPWPTATVRGFLSFVVWIALTERPPSESTTAGTTWPRRRPARRFHGPTRAAGLGSEKAAAFQPGLRGPGTGFQVRPLSSVMKTPLGY